MYLVTDSSNAYPAAYRCLPMLPNNVQMPAFLIVIAECQPGDKIVHW